MALGGSRRMMAGRWRLTALATGLLAVAIVAVASAWSSAGREPAATEGGSGLQPALARFEGDGWHIDYPSTWHRYHGNPGRYAASIGILTSTEIDTATACQTTDDTLRCDPGFIHVKDGEILINIVRVGPGPMFVDPPERWEHPDFGAPALLDGGRATHFENDASGVHSISWEVIDPGVAAGMFTFDIQIGTPAPATAFTQVAAMMQSFRFDPPLEALDPGDGDAVIARTLATMKAQETGYDCFPARMGASIDRDVSDLGGYGLTHAVRVQCSSTIEATSIGFWRVQFLAHWDATPGGPAGEMTITVWIGPTGELAGTSTESPGPPYCCR